MRPVSGGLKNEFVKTTTEDTQIGVSFDSLHEEVVNQQEKMAAKELVFR